MPLSRLAVNALALHQRRGEGGATMVSGVLPSPIHRARACLPSNKHGVGPPHPLSLDPWYAPTSQLRGRVDGGREFITSRQCLDALAVPQDAHGAGVVLRLTRLMRAHGWEPTRIGGGATKQARGYRRKTEQSPGEGDTSTPHVLGKVVSQLEMDSRWALARSVRALVAERDALRGKARSSADE